MNNSPYRTVKAVAKRSSSLGAFPNVYPSYQYIVYLLIPRRMEPPMP